MQGTDWQEKARGLRAPEGLVIGGGMRPALSGLTLESVNPATGEVLGTVPRGAAADIDAAVAAARTAFEAGGWSRCAPGSRKRTLLRLAELIEEHSAELALWDSLDGGKLIADTYGADIPGAAAILRWYAEAIDKLYGEVAPTGPGALATITREPLGVVGAVVPWNYPLEMAMWKVAPALAAGNSVVLKPAEETPFSALVLGRLALEAGVPDGVFNVVTGLGPEAGEALGRHEDVDAIVFTGSTAVGKRFLSYAAESNLKQVWPECGGKSANLVFPEIADLDAAADLAAAGVFTCAGQVCSANSRLLVHEDIYDDFVARVVSRAEAHVVGDPLDAATTLGPLVSAAQRDRVAGYVARARAGGAELVAGGGRPAGLPDGGFYLAPTVFAGVGPEDELFREEVFGPVLAITRFSDEVEAIALANSSRYGLAASVFSDDLRRAHRVAGLLQAGTVSVNTVDALDVTVPFGGVKQSGYGRDLSLHALDKFTSLKTTWFAL